MNFKPKNPVISVVIPAYNEEKFLPQCLEALKKQDFKLPFEVIVVDNNSLDKTGKIAQKAGVRVVFEKTKGIGAARETGTKAARAKIVAQTDADSRPDKNWLSEIHFTFSQKKNIIAVGGPSPFYDVGWWMKIIAGIYDQIPLKILPLLLRNGIFRGNNVAFKKSAWKKAGGYSSHTAWLDDVFFGKKLKKIGKIIFNPRQVVRISARRLKGKGMLGTFFSMLRGSLQIYFAKKREIPIEDFR